MHRRFEPPPLQDSSAGDRDLAADVVALLHRFGESTAVTTAAVGRMNAGLGTRFDVHPEWATVTVSDRASLAPRIVSAPPTGIQMRAVASMMSAVDMVGRGTGSRVDLRAGLVRARQARSASFWMFVLACATGSAALAVIFGAEDAKAVFLAAFSAAIGGIARRLLARLHVGPLAQVFAAALIAGLLGGLAVEHDLSSSLRLIAVCPAMILVPGPHVLNGTLDLLALRVSLGFARLGYAALLLLSIGGGLALGLAALGTGLPVDPAGRIVPLWLDIIAAAIAAASYPVYFSMPYRFILWPVVVGAVAHGVRWWVMTEWGWSIELGAFVACLLVGAVLAPVARSRHIPFAGVGFAAVVSLVPGVFIFRAVDAVVRLPVGGPTTDLLGGLSDGTTALLVVIAMAVGLTIPMRVYDGVRKMRGETP